MNVLEKLSRDLVQQKIITSDQLREAEKVKAQTGRSLGEALISLNFLTQEELISLISNKLEIPLIDLGSYVFESEVINLVSEQTARRYKLIPLFKVQDTLTVAMADPMNIFALDHIADYRLPIQIRRDLNPDDVYKRQKHKRQNKIHYRPCRDYCRLF